MAEEASFERLWSLCCDYAFSDFVDIRMDVIGFESRVPELYIFFLQMRKKVSISNNVNSYYAMMGRLKE